MARRVAKGGDARRRARQGPGAARVTGCFAAPPAAPVVYLNSLPVGFRQPAEHAAMIRRAAEKHLAVIERAAIKVGVPYAGVHVTNDYPADAILDVAKKKSRSHQLTQFVAITKLIR
jgi:hypothetical protein